MHKSNGRGTEIGFQNYFVNVVRSARNDPVAAELSRQNH
jgi:hypothetical protein